MQLVEEAHRFASPLDGEAELEEKNLLAKMEIEKEDVGPPYRVSEELRLMPMSMRCSSGTRCAQVWKSSAIDVPECLPPLMERDPRTLAVEPVYRDGGHANP